MKVSHFITLLVITAISFMTVAFYNGFPLTESDTGAYIQQAIYPHFAEDRTPFYGLFLRATSMWTSMWYTVFAQSIIAGWLLLRYTKLVTTINEYPDKTPVHKDFGAMLAIVLLTAAFTCVSWVSSYLMPDIFTATLLLTTILYLHEKSMNVRSRVVYLCIILAAISIHSSHFMIVGIGGVALLLWAVLTRRRELRNKAMVMIGLSFSFWLFMCCVNMRKDRGFAFSRGSNIFLVAKFSETGLLKIYLDENCTRRNLKLCNHKDQAGMNLSDFLYDTQSPLYKEGGWDSCKAEYGQIVHDVFTSPRYLKIFALKSVESTIKQLVHIEAPEPVRPQGPGQEPWKKMRQFYEDEFTEYATSKQNTITLSGAGSNVVYYLFFVLSSVWVLLYRRQVLSPELTFIYALIFSFFIINAFITSTLSTVVYRFQYRIFWILPATNVMLMVKYWLNNRSKPHKNETAS